MSRNRIYPALLGSVLLSTAAWAGGTDDMINQLLPASQRPAAAIAAPAPVLSVSAATKDQMIERLGSDLLARSIDPKTRKPRSVVLAPGHEAEDLTVFRTLPSMQVAVAFQGSSDALGPDSDVLLGRLADALSDKRLASSRFVIGVHTDSVGSDEYNSSLANLRAKAIVAQLVGTHGLSKDRLFSMGFGRMSDTPAGVDGPSERIRVVNLGDTLVKPATAAVAVAPVESKGLHARAKLASRPPVAVVHVAHRHGQPSAVARVHKVALLHPKRTVIHGPAHRYATPSKSIAHELSPGMNDAAYGSAPVTGSGMLDSASRMSSNGGGSGGSNGGGGGGGTGGGGGGGHSGGWSDRRLKRAIRRIGTSPSGLSIFSFRYVWGGPVMVGVMAQDLLQIRPDAVLVGPGGHLMVDYDKIDVTMMTLAEWQGIRAALA